MGEENSITVKGVSIRDNGRIIKCMGMEYYTILMVEWPMKVNGLRMNFMGLGRSTIRNRINWYRHMIIPICQISRIIG